MLDPKIHRERKIGSGASGTGWTVSVKGDHARYTSRCAACRCKLFDGEALISMGKRTMHRQCVKEWLEASFLQVPPQPDEIERTQFGQVDVVDVERLQREFDEYREELLQRLGVE